MRLIPSLLMILTLSSSLTGQERKRPTKEQLPELIKQLKAEKSDDRMKALTQLAILGKDTQSAQSEIESVLDKDPDPMNRRLAAKILLILDNKHQPAEKFFRDCLVSKDRQEMALLLLEAIPKVAIRILLGIPEKTTFPNKELKEVLYQFANQDVEIVLPLLQAKNAQVREATLYTLPETQLKNPVVVRQLIEAAAIDEGFSEKIGRKWTYHMDNVVFELLRKATKHENANIRSMATNALFDHLWEKKDVQKTNQLTKDSLERLKDSDERVRASAAYWVCSHSSDAKDAIPTLIGLLEDKNHQVKKAAIEALEAFGAEAISAKDPLLRIAGLDKKFRVQAIVALSRIQPTCSELIPHAVGFLSESSEERPIVLHALGRMGKTALKATEAIEPFLDSEDPDERCCAAYALICMDGNKKKAFEVLRLYLFQREEERHQRGVLELCRDAGTKAKELIPDLIQLYNDPRAPNTLRLLIADVLPAIDAEAVKKLGIKEKPKSKK